MGERWGYGDVVLRREVLGLAPVAQVEGSPPPWHGRPWMAMPVHVVEDTADALVTYIPPGAEFGFFPGEWPTPDNQHPWARHRAWSGHGCLMVQRPGDHYAVWHFWSGEQREFKYWYINIQADAVRNDVGYDTQDLELDIVVLPDGTWTLKDDDVLIDRIRDGRFSPAFVSWIESIGAELTAKLEAVGPWWDAKWSEWTPDPSWSDTPLPVRWAEIPATPRGG